MKKIQIFLYSMTFAFFMAAFSLPVMGAIELSPQPDPTVPADAVALSESDFEELQSLFPCSENGAAKDCTEEALEWTKSGSVFFRAEEHGGMYQIVTKGYVMRLKRFLPDGVYKAKKKVYFVQDGYKFWLKKGSAKKTMRMMAKKGFVTGVSADNMALFIDTSTGCMKQYPAMDSEDCSALVDALREMHERKLLMDVSSGELYYLPVGGLPLSLKTHPGDMSWFAFMKKYANAQSFSVLKQLPVM